MSPSSGGVIFTRARVSLALPSLRKNGGLLVVCANSSVAIPPKSDPLGTFRTTRININLININPNDYYNRAIDYYNPVIDYYNPIIDYYNPLLKFEPCLDQLGLLLILCRININQININPNIRSSYRLL